MIIKRSRFLLSSNSHSREEYMSSVCPKLIYSYILWKNCKNLNRKPIDLSAPNVEIQPIRLQFTLRIAVHETSVGEHHTWKMKCHGWNGHVSIVMFGALPKHYHSGKWRLMWFSFIKMNRFAKGAKACPHLFNFTEGTGILVLDVHGFLNPSW